MTSKVVDIRALSPEVGLWTSTELSIIQSAIQQHSVHIGVVHQHDVPVLVCVNRNGNYVSIPEITATVLHSIVCSGTVVLINSGILLVNTH